MGDELATSNVNRSYSLAATSIAIFTFVLFFLYPRFASGEINALLFQVTLVAMGVATFSFVFASFHYYCSSLGSRIDDSAPNANAPADSRSLTSAAKAGSAIDAPIARIVPAYAYLI